MDISKLAAPFRSADVQWVAADFDARTGKCRAIPYIDVVSVENRLDEVCGPFNWRVSFQEGPLSPGVLCSLDIRDAEHGWVTKQAASTQEALQPGEDAATGYKAVYANAFKRAATLWGIGRYLRGISAPLVAATSYGKLPETFDGSPYIPNHLRHPDDQTEAGPVGTTEKALVSPPADAVRPDAPAVAESAAPPPAEVASLQNAVQDVAPTPADEPAAPVVEPEAKKEPAVPAKEPVAKKEPAAPVKEPEAKKEPVTSPGSSAPEALSENDKQTADSLLEKVRKGHVTVDLLRKFLGGTNATKTMSEAAIAYCHARLDDLSKAAA